MTITLDEKLAYLKELLIEAAFKEDDNLAKMQQIVRGDPRFRFPTNFYNLPTSALDKCVDQLILDIALINKIREALLKKK